MKLRKTELPDWYLRDYKNQGGIFIERYEFDISDSDGYSVLIAREPCYGHDNDIRWHISIAHESRMPEWNHMVEIIHELRPGIIFVQPLVPESWWVNVHEYCVHFYETKDYPLIDQWHNDSRGDTPT